MRSSTTPLPAYRRTLPRSSSSTGAGRPTLGRATETGATSTQQRRCLAKTPTNSAGASTHRTRVPWICLFPKTKFLMPLITVVLNFKCVRFIFSGFYGMDNCLANFDEPMSSVHQHLKMLTYFNFVFVYAPIYLADLLIFSKVDWGHQVLVLAWETFIL